MSSEVIEVIGYIASGFVVLSLLMSKAIKLRVLNLCGCLIFLFYGALLPSLPIIITNGCILLTNLWHLRRLYVERKVAER